MRVMAIDAQALTLWRERTGFSKVDFAKRVGISLQYLCDIEAGRRGARPELIGRMVETYDVPRHWLLKPAPANGPEAA